jgi:Family of unknown function (DUF6069)
MTSDSAHKYAGVTLVAVIVAVATWSVIRALGVETVVGKGPDPLQVGANEVAVAALVTGLGVWAAYARLARRGLTSRWPVVGSTALAVSVIGPSWLADGASAVSLICLELAVAFVLVVGFSRGGADGSPSGQDSAHPPIG